jgi:hypothetical protein
MNSNIGSRLDGPFQFLEGPGRKAQYTTSNVTSAEGRSRYPKWEEEARSTPESFRVTDDYESHSSEFNALVDELSAASREFAH